MTGVTGGIFSCSGLLTIIFAILRIANIIAWSWTWIISPIWISFILLLVTLVILGIRRNYVEENI